LELKFICLYTPRVLGVGEDGRGEVGSLGHPERGEFVRAAVAERKTADLGARGARRVVRLAVARRPRAHRIAGFEGGAGGAGRSGGSGGGLLGRRARGGAPRTLLGRCVILRRALR